MRLAILPRRRAHGVCCIASEEWMALRDQYRVLVVEDDPDIRRILQLFLTERDFTVTTAERASVALDLMAQAPVDLILSDVRMPGMSGIELLHHIKEHDP